MQEEPNGLAFNFLNHFAILSKRGLNKLSVCRKTQPCKDSVVILQFYIIKTIYTQLSKDSVVQWFLSLPIVYKVFGSSPGELSGCYFPHFLDQLTRLYFQTNQQFKTSYYLEIVLEQFYFFKFHLKCWLRFSRYYDPP